MADQGHFENWTNVEFCNLPNNEISLHHKDHVICMQRHARARGKLLCAALRQLLCAVLSEDLESASEKPWLKVAVMPVTLNVTVMQVSDLANLV